MYFTRVHARTYLYSLTAVEHLISRKQGIESVAHRREMVKLCSPHVSTRLGLGNIAHFPSNDGRLGELNKQAVVHEPDKVKEAVHQDEAADLKSAKSGLKKAAKRPQSLPPLPPAWSLRRPLELFCSVQVQLARALTETRLALDGPTSGERHTSTRASRWATPRPR